MANNINVNMNIAVNRPQSVENRTGRESRNTIYAGAFGMDSAKGGNPVIEQKKKFAAKQAMKLINDAWKRDNKTARSMEEMQQLKEDKMKELGVLKNKVSEIAARKKALQEEYGVEADSQEQKDLELLQKYQDNKNGVSFDMFTKEELKRLDELQYTERTEYQGRMLELNDAEGVHSKNISDIEIQLNYLTQQMTDSKIEQLKSKDMIDARENADKINEAAGKEVIGILLQDAREHVEDTMEKAKEKAEKEAEKREEFKEEIEEKREERREQQAIIEGAAEADRLAADIKVNQDSETAVQEAQKDIERILKENNLINEDIKGLKIDLGF